MVIHFDYNQCPHDEKTVLTVGTFDGLHSGHQRVIQTIVQRAQVLGCRSCLVTFHPHPQTVLQSPGKQKIKVLTPIDEKISYLQAFPIDQLIVIPFSLEFAAYTAEYFVKNILLSTIGLREIIIGHDHAFGKERAGTLDTLKNMGNTWHFGITVVPPLIDNGVPVSSTLIRHLLTEGKMELAAKYLGRPYIIQGKVVSGEGRGQTFNYPTANITIEDPHKMIPCDGVYICEVEVDAQIYKGMLSIGFRPTFPELKYTIEVHILNFNKTIYDKIIKIHILRYLRQEKKFDGVGELIKQMDLDREHTFAYFTHKASLKIVS